MKKLKIRNTEYIREGDPYGFGTYYSIDSYGKNKVSPLMIAQELVLTNTNLYNINIANMPEVKTAIKYYSHNF